MTKFYLSQSSHSDFERIFIKFLHVKQITYFIRNREESVIKE